MEFKIGDKLISKVNTIFKGYYLVTDKDDFRYVLKTEEPVDEDVDTGHNFVYTHIKLIKWVEKNMYLKPE